MNEMLPDSTPETVEKVRQLLERLKRSRGSDKVAEQQIAAMGLEGALAIRALLQPSLQGSRGHLARNGRSYFLAGIFVPLALSIFIDWMCLYHPWIPRPFVTAVLALCPVAIITDSAWFVMIMNSRRPVREFHAVRDLGDPRCVPILLDIQPFLMGLDFSASLAKIVGKLRANDAQLLAPRHRRQLDAELRRHANPLISGFVVNQDYALAILAAYQQVGDHTSLSVVERLARSARNLRVREAARECLPFLQARVESEGQTLLHPSQQPGATSNDLLRPTASSSESAPEQLLRAGAPRDE